MTIFDYPQKIGVSHPNCEVSLKKWGVIYKLCLMLKKQTSKNKEK
jgi:hypothetical protein